MRSIISFFMRNWIFLSRLTITFTVLLTISGCYSNEGAVDYRKAEIKIKIPIEPGDTNSTPTQDHRSNNTCLGRVGLIKQDRRSNDPEAIIKKMDSITIRLRRAFIKDFKEEGINPFEPSNLLKKNGEIAIIVKAFEFGKGKDFNFGPEGIKEGRLVFYSADVEEGQFLNLHNMPIYGPIEYGGTPLGIEIAIVEMDEMGEQFTAVISNLAKIGAQAYPPASPILPVLESFGKSMLSEGTNDIEMRFAMVLDPPEGYDGFSYPTVEVGNYVFIKQEDRQTQIRWDDLELDDNTGILYIKNGNKREYRGNTYLVFQINKGFNSKDLDLSQNTYGDFLVKLKAEDVRMAKNITSFLKEIKGIGLSRVQKSNFIDAKALLLSLQKAKAKKPVEPSIIDNFVYDLARVIKETTEVPDANDWSMSQDQIIYLLDSFRHMAHPSQNEYKWFDITELKQKGKQEIFETWSRLLKGGSSS